LLEFTTVLWYQRAFMRRDCLSSWLPAFLVVLLPLLQQPATAADGLPLLTNAARIKSLPSEHAILAYPVILEGIIISVPGPDAAIVKDASASIWVNIPSNVRRNLKRGDRVRIEGVSEAGGYARTARARKITPLGQAELPAPTPVTYSQISAGNWDCEWVQVRGVVRAVILPDKNRSQRGQLYLSTEGRKLLIDVPPTLRGYENLVDAEVTIKGMVLYLFNPRRQFYNIRINIPDHEPIKIEQPAPEDPFAAPVRQIRSLLLATSESASGHRVRVRAVVTHHQPGTSIYVRDETQPIQVLARDQEPLEAGDVVDILGFPARGEYGPVLEDAVYRKLEKDTPPKPVLISALAPFEYDSQLVMLHGELVDKTILPDSATLTLKGENRVFNAVLKTAAGQPKGVDMPVGSRLQIVGICKVVMGDTTAFPYRGSPEGFSILLRSARDIQLVSPPFWLKRADVAWGLGAIALVLVAILAVLVTRSRARLAERAVERQRAEAEFSAVLNERNRMAREIHDTLAQGLTAISAQLEVLRHELPPERSEAKARLDTARSLVRMSLEEARRSIWNMRAQILDQSDLPTALRQIVEQLTANTPIHARVSVTGTPRPLSPLLENDLLRIGQETATNAVRHAQPKIVHLELVYDADRVSLRVRDDGCGFDAQTARPSQHGGFGLAGIRERVARAAGSVSVNTAPGQGTEINVVLPAPAG
jgi:signal transduction histidine kinase